jgi:predicted transcriptional regulator
MPTHEIKSLMTRIKTSKQSIEKINSELSSMLAHHNSLESRLKDLQSKEAGLVVTEHAMLRYLERVIGLDLNDIREEIITDQLKKQWGALGSGKYPVKNFKVVIKQNMIVTIE